MLKRIGAEEGGEFKAVASGTLPSGKPVVVNADGTVSVISASDAELGSAQVLSASHQSAEIRVAYDANAGSYVIVYKDNGGDSGKGYVVAATLSGSTLTFGTPVKFIDSVVEAINIVYHEAAQKTVIVFSDDGAGKPGRGIVVTTTGTSVSLGAAGNMGTNVDSMTAVYDANAEKIVAAFRDRSNNFYGTAIVGTVSGTSISWGSKVVYNSAQSTRNVAVYDSSAQKVGIFYRDNGRNSGQGSGITGTVSGTSISFGGETGIGTSSNTVDELWAGYDPVSGKIAVVYTDSSNGSIITYSVAEISGTSMLVYSGGTDGSETAGGAGAGFPTVALSDGTLMLVYRLNSGSSGVFKFLTIDGSANTISFSSPKQTYQSAAVYSAGVAYDSTNEKVVIAYGLVAGREAIVYSLASTNLTSENYIGMSRGVAFQTGSAASAGSPVVFESAEIDRTQTVFDSQNNKIVITFRDAGNSYYGTAIVGTVNNSDNSISFGTPVVIESATLGFFGTLSFDSSNNKVVVPYEISSQGKVKIGTVSGTSISFGSAVNINDPCSSITTVFDSNSNKVAFLYSGTSNYTKSKVGTVSGTSISFGTEVNIANAQPGFTSGAFDSNANKVVFAYRRSSQGRAIVGTISGTDISFGSEAVFHNTNAQQTSTTFDTSNNKIVISYQDYSASPRAGNAVVGTVSGTDISFGSPVTFNATIAEDTAIVFDSSVNKVIIFYDDADNSNYGTAISGTVSGTTVSFDSETVFESASVEKISAAFDSNANRAVVAYEDVGNSQYGTAAVFNPTTIATTRGEVASGQAASMDIIGSVSDNQIGLTAGQQYFVQTDGTISTTADSPSVLAGTAISATELVVKT